jgi:hypothetical protein
LTLTSTLEDGPEGKVMEEQAFRAALAKDVCGTQVFAQGMKLFLTVRRCAGLGVCVWSVCICMRSRVCVRSVYCAIEGDGC